MIPGLPGSQVSNDGDSMRMIQDLQRDIRELRAQNVLATAGITAEPGSITVTGTENITGDLNVSGAATITGTLSLPAGIIGNDALTSPVAPLATHVGNSNFGLSGTAFVQVIGATISVPAGYTQALVFATATMHVYNDGATDDAYLSVGINGNSIGASSQMTANAGQGVIIPASGTALLTGLGSSFPVNALARGIVHAWSASTVNFINLDVMTIFLR